MFNGWQQWVWAWWRPMLSSLWCVEKNMVKPSVPTCSITCSSQIFTTESESESFDTPNLETWCALNGAHLPVVSILGVEIAQCSACGSWIAWIEHAACGSKRAKCWAVGSGVHLRAGGIGWKENLCPTRYDDFSMTTPYGSLKAGQLALDISHEYLANLNVTEEIFRFDFPVLKHMTQFAPQAEAPRELADRAETKTNAAICHYDDDKVWLQHTELKWTYCLYLRIQL